MGRILLKGGTVVTMDAGVPDLPRGDVLIIDERIAAIGAELPAPDGAEVIDASDLIVMPELINAHLHTWQSALRGVAADWTVAQYMAAMHRGLATHFRPEDIYIANLMGALNQINSGTTTVVDWCHNNPTPAHTDAAIQGLEDAGSAPYFCTARQNRIPSPDRSTSVKSRCRAPRSSACARAASPTRRASSPSVWRSSARTTPPMR